MLPFIVLPNSAHFFLVHQQNRGTKSTRKKAVANQIRQTCIHQSMIKQRREEKQLLVQG